MKTREIRCEDNSDQTVDMSNCANLTRPDATITCPATPACVTYNWVVSTFTPECLTTCGQPEVTQTRSVICRSSLGVNVDDDFCHGDKPSTTAICPSTPACGIFYILKSFTYHINASFF